jgi:hypothetical protein
VDLSMARNDVANVLDGPRTWYQCSMLNDMKTWSWSSESFSTSANSQRRWICEAPCNFGALWSTVFVFLSLIWLNWNAFMMLSFKGELLRNEFIIVTRNWRPDQRECDLQRAKSRLPPGLMHSHAYFIESCTKLWRDRTG